MNLVDATVKEVLSAPYALYGRWWVDVKYSSWGDDSTTEIMCQTREEAEAIKPGYRFLT